MKIIAEVSAVWMSDSRISAQPRLRCSEAHRQHGDAADRGAFGRREDAAIDAADDGHGDEHDRPDAHHGLPALGPADPLHGGAGLGSRRTMMAMTMQ